MEDGWCDAFKVPFKRKGKVKRRKLQACMTKKLTELDEKVCCEMSGLVSPEYHAAYIEALKVTGRGGGMLISKQ